MNNGHPREPQPPAETPAEEKSDAEQDSQAANRAKEIGGRKGPEPTRFGDWEKNGRCIDF